MEWETSPTSPSSLSSPSATSGLRRRNNVQPASYSNTHGSTSPSSNPSSSYDSKQMKKKVVRKLDLFPKIEQDLVAQSSSGTQKLTTIAYSITILIILAELYSHYTTNHQLREHVSVDKSLNAQMRVDLNITFPALHCDDVHMDIMDVAGDAHNDVEDTIVKNRLHIDGSKLSSEEIRVDVNKAFLKEKTIMEAIDATLAKDYCGPCYGAGEEMDCCNHCSDVMEKYTAKKWNVADVNMIAEQCVREEKNKPKRMRFGEGCNIAGYMKFNRVNGNFHIAMGEGVERHGSHIHSFIPDDVTNFNASHIIHDLRFGPDYSNGLKTKLSSEPTTLQGVKKIVTEENGVTGMFQYFIKIVPTTYKGKKVVQSIAPNYDFSKDNNDIPQLETNRYFTTERFTPLMLDIDDENWELGEIVSNRFQKHHELIKEQKEQKAKEKAEVEADHDDDGDDDGHRKLTKAYKDHPDFDDYYDFYYERQEKEVEEVEEKIAAAKVGGNTGTSHHAYEHHRKQQSILPGIFFIYQIYPFSVEISKDHVPFSHLFIRILSTIGGVFTIMSMIDTVLSSRRKKRLR